MIRMHGPSTPYLIIRRLSSLVWRNRKQGEVIINSERYHPRVGQTYLLDKESDVLASLWG